MRFTRATVSLLSLLALALVSACKDPPPPPPPVNLTEWQKSETRGLIEAARARVKAAEQKRERAFERPGAKVRPTAAPCPVGRKELGIADDITSNGLTAKLLGMTRVDFGRKGGSLPSSVASGHLDTEAMMITRHLDDALSYGQTYERFLADVRGKLDAVRPSPFELALVLDEFSNPERLDDRTFRGGDTRGVLYLWSETAGALICAAPVGARSAAEVSTSVHSFTGRPTQEEMRTAVSAHLTGELLVRTIDGGLYQMLALEPLPPPAPAPPSKRHRP